MTDSWAPTTQTVWAVVIFCAVYLAYLTRKLKLRSIDLYDFLSLSSVAIVPALFVLLPGLSDAIGHLLGVHFPFIIMFSLLFVIVFGLIHHLTTRLHRVENQCRALIQELAIARLGQGQPDPGSEHE